MTATVEELLDGLLDAFCQSCGKALPERGAPCGGCGQVPALTRAEATERLGQPGVRAAIEASRLRGQVQAEQERLRGMLAEADLIEHVDRLEQARDQVAAGLPAARDQAARLAGEFEAAQEREREAAARVLDARRNYRECADREEAARRCGADARTRTEALMMVQAAAPVLEADQAAHAAAVAERERAERLLRAASDAVTALEAELAAAERVVAEPGRAPKSLATLTLDLVHQAAAGDLTDDEAGLVRGFGEALAQLTGAAEEIAAQAVELADKRRASEARMQPVFTRMLADGTLEAVPNSLAPGTPRR